MPPLPGARRHSPSLRIVKAGLLAGTVLSAIAVTWLLLANRVPALDRFAFIRNLAAGVFAVIVMIVPACRLRHHPSYLFISNMIAWLTLTAVYSVLQIPFPHLATRIGTFRFFVIGAMVLGLASALIWVLHLLSNLWGEVQLAPRKRMP